MSVHLHHARTTHPAWTRPTRRRASAWISMRARAHQDGRVITAPLTSTSVHRLPAFVRAPANRRLTRTLAHVKLDSLEASARVNSMSVLLTPANKAARALITPSRMPACVCVDFRAITARSTTMTVNLPRARTVGHALIVMMRTHARASQAGPAHVATWRSIHALKTRMIAIGSIASASILVRKRTSVCATRVTRPVTQAKTVLQSLSARHRRA